MNDLMSIRREWETDSSAGYRVVAFGASNTAIGWHNESYYPWASWVAAALRSYIGSHIAVVNVGISGNDTGQMLDRIDRDVAPLSPHTVIVTAGGNDVRKFTIKEYVENLHQIGDRCRDMGAHVIYQTYYAFDVARLERDLQVFPSYMAACAQCAADRGSCCIDQHSWFHPWYADHPVSYRAIMRDPMHLNPIGNAIMGTLVVRCFQLPDPVLSPDIKPRVEEGLGHISQVTTSPARVAG